MLVSYGGNSGGGTNDLVAVYCYCRSILVLHPFVTGMDNLKIAFEKNSTRFIQTVNSSKQPVYNTGGIYNPQSPFNRGNEKQEQLRFASKSTPPSSSSAEGMNQFIQRFLFIGGMIFSMIEKISISKDKLSKQDGSNIFEPLSTLSHKDLDAEISSTFAAVIHHTPILLDQLEQVLLLQEFTDDMLLRIITIAIFLVHFSRDKVTALSSKPFVNESLLDASNDGNDASLLMLEPLSLSNSPDIRPLGDSIPLVLLYSIVNR